MGPYTAPQIAGRFRRRRSDARVRHLLACSVLAVFMVLTLLPAKASAEKADVEFIINLGIIQAPLLNPPSAGHYVRLLISLEIGEDVDRRAVTRHLTRLRDTVMRDLYSNPIPPNRKDNVIDVAAIEDRLLGKVAEVVGSRQVERVHVYEVNKNQVCDKSAPVGAWSQGCH